MALLLQERYAMINVTPRSLHWLLRTFLLNKEAAVISRNSDWSGTRGDLNLS